MDCSLNAPIKKGNVRSAWVWFEGTTALKEGQGVCYNAVYGTDTAADARRYNRVALPANGIKAHFAGVAARDYAAVSTGRMIEIYLPGSVCIVQLKIGVSTTIGATELVCTYTSGNFKAVGAESGQGCATALQTVTGGAAVLPCLAVLNEGLRATLPTD